MPADARTNEQGHCPATMDIQYVLMICLLGGGPQGSWGGGEGEQMRGEGWDGKALLAAQEE